MGMELVVKDNIDEVIKDLKRLEKKQVPFATSRALNDTAINAQEAIIKYIQLKFDNKKKWYVKGSRRTGVRVKFSKKTNLTARVYTDEYFAELQEDGGIKSPRTAQALAVPAKNIPKTYKKSGGAVKAMNLKGAYTKKMKSGNEGIFRKASKKAKAKLMFTLTRTAMVLPRLKFVHTGTVAAKRKFKRNFERRLKEAIASSKHFKKN